MSDAKTRRDAARALAESNPESLLCIIGPTATGKTDVAIDLANDVDGEIVSADSIQIYRLFDRGSGKPTAEERARAPHHLIDVMDPKDAIDARAYATAAGELIRSIKGRGRRPIVCGGTFLWVKALVFGLADAPGADEALRNAHRALVEAQGRPALHARLAAVDPKTAARLHPNDFIRVSRALEVFEQGGTTMSQLQESHGFRDMAHPATFIALGTPPAELTSRIERRVHAWLQHGWVEEVRELIERGYGDARAMGSVGYREVQLHLRGELPASELTQTIVRATRVYARRQRTWLNHVPVSWI